MTTFKPLSPVEIFSEKKSKHHVIPNVLNAPLKYIQGVEIMNNLGLYLNLLNSERVAILITKGGEKRYEEEINESLKCYNIDSMFITFGGECSNEKI